jgi:hypothetical protein
LRIQFLDPGSRIDEYEATVGRPTLSVNVTTQDAYLCSEISIRKILHSAKETRIRHQPVDNTIGTTQLYRPRTAEALDVNLAGWFQVLPECLRFAQDFNVDGLTMAPDVNDQVALLRMDYFGIHAVIHWPMVNSIKASGATDITVEQLPVVKKFFDAVFHYIAALTPLMKFRHPNLWTVAHGYGFDFWADVGLLRGRYVWLLRLRVLRLRSRCELIRQCIIWNMSCYCWKS